VSKIDTREASRVTRETLK